MKFTLKTVIVYLIISIFCFAVNRIYAIFGHGVSSAYMTWMFLYPLLGGALFYLIIELFLKNIKHASKYRLFYNIYNSAIAILTVGSFLKGIFDIAGTNSPYVLYYFVTGWVCIACSLFVLASQFVLQKK
jgi:hypothetical protein